MTVEKPSYETWRDRAALGMAERIEDIFCQSHAGGRTQRLALIQLIILDAMDREVKGFLAQVDITRNAQKT